MYNWQVAILTNEAPVPRGSSPVLDFGKKAGDVDMADLSSSFPVTNLYELENRVFKDDWSIPYRLVKWQIIRKLHIYQAFFLEFSKKLKAI